jgi:subtilisin family serine protease
MNGQRLELVQHPTDFSVIGRSNVLSDASISTQTETRRLSANMARVRAKDSKSRDQIMDAVREETVAHHIYQVKDTEEEIVIDNRILLTLRNENPEAFEKIVSEFHLVPEGKMGRAYILRVTEATGMNPLKAANSIARREGVESCTPQVLMPLQMHQTSLADTHRLFRRQWYLTADLISSPDLDPTASIRAPEAWQITMGSTDIVVAVIDDGFDLGHPAFRNKRIHPDKRDFAVISQDEDPLAENDDFHGTCVASIATGSLEGDGMVGVAPDCTLLPIRIGFGPMAAPVDILEVFRYVSQRADVVNCSFGVSPTSFDPFPTEFRNAITELTLNGGRRGKGLVMVFSAANDDAPTLLTAAENKNGVFFVRFTPFGGQIAQIPKNKPVFSGYPLTRGVIVVAAMSSLKRKSGYSSWGRQITVTAPSNNMHYIARFVKKGVNDAVRDKFLANYRGLGQVAAANRPTKGTPFDPMPDDPATQDFAENFYTITFGGTSGAAPVVTGVVALMLSVNPNLTAEQVKQILIATADRDLDPTLDLNNDPNVQGLTGEFNGGHSLFFGAGKVNALRAVERARALLGPNVTTVSSSAPCPDRSFTTINGQALDYYLSAREGMPGAEIPSPGLSAILPAEAPVSPTPAQCSIWRFGPFRQKVLIAVARWALEPPQNILPTNTLGELAKGSPWNEGQQARLVQSTNDPVLDVFAPFSNTKMVPPPLLLPPSTTVAQWERVVWQRQFPHTPCFFLVG